MQIDLTIDTEDLRQQALKTAREAANRIVHRYLEKHFATGAYYGQPKGAGTLEIEAQIDELICGDAIDEQIDAIDDLTEEY